MKINDVDLIWLGHASFLIKWNGKNIYFDPYKITNSEEKADYIFITHEHFDHCSIEDIEKIVKPDTKVILPSDCMSKVRRFDVDMIVVQPNKEYNVDDIKVLTVPAYNTNKDFHPKDNEWVGYVLNLNGTRIYHAGDTDVIHEMAQLNGKVDVALLPVGGTYTMNAEDASYAVKLIKPKIVVPMHYGTIVGSIKDAERLKELLKDENVQVLILNKNE